METPSSLQYECDGKNQYSFTLTDTGNHEMDTLLQTLYSKEMLIMARSMGLTSQLIRLDSLHQLEKSPPNLLKAHQLEAEILLTIQRVDLEINDFNERLDCKIKKCRDLKNQLATNNNAFERRLTITAIIVAGATAVASGIMALGEDRGSWEVSTTNDYIGAVGGVYALYLGLRALRINTRLQYEHKRNIIPELHQSSSKKVIPQSLIYFLNQDVFFNGKGNWYEQVQKGYEERFNKIYKTTEEKEAARSILLGDGGTYTYELMQIRENFFSDLGNAVGIYKLRLEELTYQIKMQNIKK